MPLKSAMSEKNTVSVRRSAWSAPLPIKLVDEARIDEFAERVLDALARAQLLDHAVERPRQLADLVARENDHRRRIRAGRDGAGAGHELAQSAHRLGRTHRADAEADAAGGDEQGKAQIGVELLPRQHGAGGAIGQAGEAAPDFRQVRAEGLRVLLKAERGSFRLVALAVGKPAHRLFADSQKPVEATSDVFERAFDARQVDAVLGPVVRILDRPLQQRLDFVDVLPQLIGQRLLGGGRRLRALPG